ncbi:UDP-glycosyltransferase UGT4-like [Leguminivora glycinivorella]|uniref:UDP-glycosyltransferase UGT4-like n=1 Tax=Leguminivora glycinivorella TaxID=1035111 RepID=UPI00200D1718|nr:UDP-glycosyltransferase UGT4-like [Leguminivora glycinivorella]
MSRVIPLVLLALLAQTTALNVLVIVSIPIPSHYMALNTLFRELAHRGHKVTVMNNFPDKNPTPGLEFIDLNAYQPGAVKTADLEYYESLYSWYVPLYNLYRHFKVSPGSTADDCENLFTHKKVKEHLDKKNKYDVIFVEQFMSDCGFAYAAAMYDSPIIGITSHVMLPMHYSRMGLPFDVRTHPHYFFNAGSNPSLWQRVQITVADFMIQNYMKWNLQESIRGVFAKHLPGFSVDLEKIARERMAMMFLYQHHSITGGRLLAPQVLEIAGIHIQKPKPMPKDIEEFLASAEHGVIYISFGSLLRSHSMSDHKRMQFVKAFGRIPQKVIWKWGNESFPEKSDKLLVGSWFPQLDILCHPKVLAFISHGGMLSMSEAAHCGKPLLTVPFFGDQFSNAASARESGLGLTMFFEEINGENLEAAVRELTSERMQSNAKRISQLWHARPLPVMDSAIYWTEYVARHRTAPPSLPQKLNTSSFNTSPLDVVCVIVTIVFVVLFVIYAILKAIFQFVRGLITKVLCKKSKQE